MERALHKARKAKQKENVISDLIANTEIKTETDENGDAGAIILNATAEFCRTLGLFFQLIPFSALLFSYFFKQVIFQLTENQAIVKKSKKIYLISKKT